MSKRFSQSYSDWEIVLEFRLLYSEAVDERYLVNLAAVTSVVFPLGSSGRCYFLVVQQAILTKTLNCTEASGTDTMFHLYSFLEEISSSRELNICGIVT